MLQCVAGCCNVWGRVLQGAAVYCSVLQCVAVRACMYVVGHIEWLCLSTYIYMCPSKVAYTHACMYVYMCICVRLKSHTRVHAYTCIFVYVYMYMYMYMCICTYVHIRISISFGAQASWQNTNTHTNTLTPAHKKTGPLALWTFQKSDLETNKLYFECYTSVLRMVYWCVSDWIWMCLWLNLNRSLTESESN